MINACQHCSKLFHVKPSHSSRRKFCSRHCSYSARFGDYNIPSECQFCGTKFTIDGYRKRNSKKVFCSMKCYGMAKRRRVEYECLNCLAPVTRKRSEGSYSDRHFCSQKCCITFFVGKTRGGNNSTSGYGPGWRRFAAEARARDKVCRLCGKTAKQNGRKLDVHHRIPFIKFGFNFRIMAHAQSNLMSLCKSCHRWAEANPV